MMAISKIASSPRARILDRKSCFFYPRQRYAIRASGHPRVEPAIHRVGPESGSTLRLCYRDFYSNGWVNSRFLAQRCGFCLQATPRASGRRRRTWPRPSRRRRRSQQRRRRLRRPRRPRRYNHTGLAQITGLGPTLCLKIPIRALKLAHNLGQPCTIFVPRLGKLLWPQSVIKRPSPLNVLKDTNDHCALLSASR
jgi:hypothetical protein